MGGKAIKDAQRIDKRDYLEIAAKLEKIGVLIIPSYSEKSTFGDLDCLISNEMLNSLYKKDILIKAGFDVVEEVKNTNVTSFGVKLKDKIFQIDVISHHSDIIDFAYNYYSFNDLGNLIGRIARSLGLKFSHAGLIFTQRDKNGNLLKEHVLSLDFSESLEYLGLDPNRFYAGFDSLQDIFEYVISSKYYNFDRFDLTLRNSTARRRDLKRPTYTKFLEFAKNLNIQNNLESKEIYLNSHFKKFPEFKKAYGEELIKLYYINRYKKKFSGNLVKEITNLEGKELGEFMKFIDGYFTQELVLSSTEIGIKSSILKLYNEFKQEVINE